MIGLVALGQHARYVVYCYGQTLQPGGERRVLDTARASSACVTNYQVTAESAARAVIRVDNANTQTPHVDGGKLQRAAAELSEG